MDITDAAICTNTSLESDHEDQHHDSFCVHRVRRSAARSQLRPVLLVAVPPGASQDLIPNAILEAQPVAGLYRL